MNYSRIKNKLEDLKFWFYYRFNPKHKYHLVNTKLGYGFWDIKERMFHANFELLVEYIEDCLNLDFENQYKEKYEKGFATLDMWIEDLQFGSFVSDESKRWAKNYQKIKDLYVWYKFNRKQEIEKITENLNKFDLYLVDKYKDRNILYDITLGRCLTHYKTDTSYIDNKDVKQYMKLLKEQVYLEKCAAENDKQKLTELISCWEQLTGL